MMLPRAGGTVRGVSPPPATPQTGPDPGRRPVPRVRHRPSWIVFVVLGSIFCLAMGYWQLTRYQSASGNVQNLGYTFMWPFLGMFLFYAYFRYIRLEAEEAARAAEDSGVGDDDAASGPGDADRDGDDDRQDPTAAPRPAGRGRRRTVAQKEPTAIPEDVLPARRRPPPEIEDETLRAYNEYLAELARRDAAGR